MPRQIGRIIFAAAITAFLSVIPVHAAEETVHLYFFNSATCAHCAKEDAFLDAIAPEYPYLTVSKFEVTQNYGNAVIFSKVGRELGLATGAVPMTFIGGDYVSGYQDDETTGKEIRALIEKYHASGDPDPVGAILSGKKTESASSGGAAQPDTLNVPFIGKTDLRKLSLPVLTFVIALLDGFNPCAMWTLLFLISLLLSMKDRLKMWILGSAFIAASALVYFMFLAAWLNLFLFLGMIIWVRIGIGLLAIFAGTYYLRDFLKNRNGACAVAGTGKRRKIFESLKKTATRPEFVPALVGIILLAFAVNVVELVCSAGLPAVYTRILTQSALPVWQHYLYLLFYITVFMLDDMFVFIAAMTTLKVVGLNTKYAGYSHLAGGFIMLAIGFLMIFAPQYLTFG